MATKIQDWLNSTISIAPLVYFRIAFGALMLFSTLRFWALGWIEEHYLEPVFHFRYFGFEWVPIGPDWVIYLMHIIMIISSLGILLGAYYRISTLLFFLSFSYTELIDLTYYLNHYYFVSLVALLLIFLPADRYFSIDVWLGRISEQEHTKRWTLFILQFQLFVVYFFAGIAKINHDWLFEALPLRIWLPANDTLPLLGWLFTFPETAYVFSWMGMIYDTTIVFFLLWKPTRWIAYASVIFFHTITGLLFQIGVFPIVMIATTPIFFDSSWHQKLINSLKNAPVLFGFQSASEKNDKSANCGTVLFLKQELEKEPNYKADARVHIPEKSFLIRNVWLAVYVIFQLVFPFRYLFYPGNLYWTEQGYRFSWRVMLVEKAGTAHFFVKDSQSGREGVVDNSEFLNRHQEKQMSFQPDMMLQFAHFLARHYAEKGVYKPQVRVESYVTMNARPSQLIIDPTVNLAAIQDSWVHKHWILPLK